MHSAPVQPRPVVGVVAATMPERKCLRRSAVDTPNERSIRTAGPRPVRCITVGKAVNRGRLEI